MSRTKKIAILAVIAMVLTMLPVQMFAATTAADSTRLFGAGRVETALAVCDAGWTSASTVIVAAADQANLVDALAAAPLAGQEDAPILLTFKDSLDPAVKAKISALGASKVYVVGAVSDAVKAEIDGISGVTAEALKGSSRWDTAKEINDKLVSPAGCFVVGYAALADALSVSAYAAANNYAIILADVNGDIPVAQSALGSKTYIVGGSSLVGDIAGATRLAGTDRFATNKEVLETLTFDYNKVYVANGFNNHLVDSLVAAPLAAKYNAAIVLADNDGIAASATVNANLSATSQVVALGGTGVVSDTVRDAVQYNTPATFAVEDVVCNSLSSILVTFNQEIDEDTAETTTNYKIDGTNVAATNKAVLQSDKKSVLITWSGAAFNQYQDITFEVRGNLIYNSSKAFAAASYSKVVTMSDTTVPTLASVAASGNKKVKVYFSEPVRQPAIGDARQWEIDGTKLSSLGLTNITNVDVSGGTAQTCETDLYFGTALAAGTHTLKVAAGTNAGQLSDVAGFVFAAETVDFTVDSVTGNCAVESVSVANNVIKVVFDRAMYSSPTAADATDANSVKNVNNFNINDQGAGATSVSAVAFKSGTGETTVEVTAQAGMIQNGLNVIVIDKDIKDAFGNKLSDGNDNIRVSFNYEADNTKPTVTSVSCTASNKIRVQFSEKVNATYAATAGNYTLKDADGVAITVTPATVPAATNSDTVELTPVSNLRGSGYSLQVKNIPDIAVNPNVMDTYTTTFDGIDDLGPNVSQVIDVAADATKATVFFNEAMDNSTIIVDNFGYVDGAGDANGLPSGTTLSIDATSKIVTVDFPAAYVVSAGGVSALNDKYEVVSIRVSNAKDKAGNLIQGVAQTTAIAANTAVAAGQRPTYVADTFNLYDNGSDIKAEFLMSQELTTLSISDFLVGVAGAGVAADSGYIQAKKVILNFTTDAKVDTIRYAGVNAMLDTIASPASTNVGGIAPLAFAGNGYQVYDDQVRPRLDSYVFTSVGGNDKVELTFTEPVDATILGLYTDDIQVLDGTTVLSLTGPTATNANATLVYDIADAAYASGLTLKVKSTTDIRDAKDRKEDYNSYVSTSDDQTGYTISAAGALEAVAPTMTSWTMDMASDGAAKSVTVYFSEPVMASTVTTGIAAGDWEIQGAAGAPGGAAATFPTTVTATQLASNVVKIANLGEATVTKINTVSAINVTTGFASYFLTHKAGAFDDMAGNASVAGVGIALTAASKMAADTTAPAVTAITRTAALTYDVTVSDYLTTADYANAAKWASTGTFATAGAAKGATDLIVTLTAGAEAATNDTVTMTATDAAGNAASGSANVITANSAQMATYTID